MGGPTAVPGTYTVRLSVGDFQQSQSWEWKKDPRVEATQDDFQEQFDFLIRIRDKMTEINTSIIRLRTVKEALDQMRSKLRGYDKGESLIQEAVALHHKLTAVEDVLIQSKSKSGQDPLNFPILLDNKIAALTYVVGAADARPTDQSYVVYETLVKQADAQLDLLKTIMESDLPALNDKIRKAGIPFILIK